MRSVLALLSVLLIAVGFALWGLGGKQHPPPIPAAPQPIRMPSYPNRVPDASPASAPQQADPEASLAALRHACYQRETDDHAAKIKSVGGDPDEAIKKLEIAGTYKTGIYETCMLSGLSSADAQRALQALPSTERAKWDAGSLDLKAKLAEIRRLARFRELYSKAAKTPAAMTPAEVKELGDLQVRGRDPAIGMTEWEVLASPWGEPIQVNTTETARGTRAQWFYRSRQAYLYFDDGVLVAIQR